ncbi:MAG: hypothetical protein mread185_000188 [Mycoplasmataceae bacterium]|nr:MAG: hypothetical protein mread185_000188 [Mycoplasmataceae bacterium]
MPNIEPQPFITLADIQVNPEHWNQKISIIRFVDKNGKSYWNKDYNFIPHWKRYNEAVKWIKSTEFPEYDCKIVWNDNNGIEIVTQNYFGTIIVHEQDITWIIRKIQQKIIREINNKLNFNNEDDLLIKKDLEEVMTFKTYQEFKDSPYSYLYEEHLAELKSAENKKGKLTDKDLEKQSYDFARPDLAILWRKQLYFITHWKYIDNYRLFVQIKAKKCFLFPYYWNWMKTRGTGTIEQAPKLIAQSQNNLMESQRLHYDFCDDLGLKRIYNNEMGYQPKFSLFMGVLNKPEMKLVFSEQKTKNADGQEGKQLIIPTNVEMIQVPNAKESLQKEFSRLRSSHAGFWSLIFSMVKGMFGGGLEGLTEKLTDQEIFVSVGPEEHKDGRSFYSNMTSHQDILFSDNKKVGEQYKEWHKKQPHLFDHTTFQFIFLNDIIMSANAQFLGIKYDKEKDQFILPYKTFINHNAGNLYYRWEIGHITIKCEVKTMGTFSDPNNPARIIGSLSWKSPQIGGGFTIAPMAGGTGGGGGGTGPWHAGGTALSWNNDKSSADEAKKSAKAQKKGDKEAKKNEKIFDKFKSDLNKTVDPSVFNTGTIDFNYSLGEFFNRLTDPVFFYRMYISQLLYTKLEKWCNSKSEILGLPLQWEELVSWTQGSEQNDKDTRKLGKWRWSEVLLEGDINYFFTDIMEKGYFLDGGEKLKNPDLGMEVGRDYIKVGANAWDITVAEEHWKETKEQVKEELMTADIKDADYNNDDYIGSPDDNIWQELNRANNNVHTGTSPFNNNCLGCLCNGGSHGKPDYNFERIYHFASGGKLVLKTRGSGIQECQIPDKGGKVVFKATGNTAKLTLEYEKITRESYFVETKTKTQEIDQEQLENEIAKEIENIENETLNENELEKESGADGIGDGLEKEREREKEFEQETETEQEKEQGVENEKRIRRGKKRARNWEKGGGIWKFRRRKSWGWIERKREWTIIWKISLII